MQIKCSILLIAFVRYNDKYLFTRNAYKWTIHWSKNIFKRMHQPQFMQCHSTKDGAQNQNACGFLIVFAYMCCGICFQNQKCLHSNRYYALHVYVCNCIYLQDLKYFDMSILQKASAAIQ